MSGGSYEYAYQHVRTMAHNITDRLRDGDPSDRDARELRAKFAAHLELVADAMRAVEWVDSCDWGDGDEVAAIRAVLPGPTPPAGTP